MKNTFLIITLLFSINIAATANNMTDNTKVNDDEIKITNVSSGIVKIEVETESLNILNIWVCNMSGKKLFETNDMELNLNSYENGTYFIQIKTTSGVITKKIIKQS